VARDVKNLQNGESSVVLVTDQPKVLPHSIDGGIGYVDPIQESKDVDNADDKDDPEINLPDQRTLVDAWVHLLVGDIFVVGEPPVSGGSRGTQSWNT